VDSRTTVDSVGEQTAARHSVPFVGRDVFMDNERTREEISQSLSTGIARAQKRGAAVLIGHVHTPQILAILTDEEQALRESEIRLVGLAEIIQ
jgi:polysaccharide deacetylase 2 family uncharacterized protein YibQ